MLTSILVIAAGLLGIVGHWVTRWSQDRTQSTFWEYMAINKANTIASFFTNIAASSGIASTIKPDMDAQQILMLALFSYSTGYMLDSKVNKDITPSQIAIEKFNVEEIKREDKKKSLDAVLDDDGSLK